MTHKQYIIDQTKKRIKTYSNKCAYCSESAQGRAHIIPQRLVKKYGWLIIDHWQNFHMTCNKHNSTTQINTTDEKAMENQLNYILKNILWELRK